MPILLFVSSCVMLFIFIKCPKFLN
jgi:hypothetical protein